MSAGLATVGPDEGDQRLDRWLKRRFPALPHGQVQKLLRTGQIRVDGKRAEASQRLAVGQSVRLPPQLTGEAPAAQPRAPRPVSDDEAADLRARVLFQDDWAIALDKPAGLAVQGGSGQSRPLDHLLGALAGAGQEVPRLVHRLDRDTSGVLLLGRTAQATRALAAAFKERSARKLYLAIIAGRLEKPAGRIDLPLAKGREGDERELMTVDPNGDPAVTLYAVAQTTADGKASLVALSPLTGRTHQLRVHLAHLGHPILGDGKYGGRRAHPPLRGLPGQLLLHARELAVPHPEDGTTLRVEAPLPPHFRQALKALELEERRVERAVEELEKRGL